MLFELLGGAFEEPREELHIWIDGVLRGGREEGEEQTANNRPQAADTRQ
jgi:hypothetical protein